MASSFKLSWIISIVLLVVCTSAVDVDVDVDDDQGEDDQLDDDLVADDSFYRSHDAISYNPETSMTAPEIIQHRGYPVEIHRVTTADHYVLELHRIPHGRLPYAKTSGRPVLLQHGVFSSSASWLINPTNSALAFRLADLGYDVWMGNTRGNTYSRRHLLLQPDDSHFWQFSWDELGMYDVPAFIDYILACSKWGKLTYIGHSLGTAEFFIAMIQHPRLNDKIHKMMALAPISSKARLQSPVKLLFPLFKPAMTRGLEKFQKKAILDNTDFMRKIQRNFCEANFLKAAFCRDLIFKFIGSNPEMFDLNRLPLINSHLLQGTSIRVMAQFAQHYNEDEEVFMHYNYGAKENLRRYGQREPWIYDLKRVTAPVYIYYGDNDLISTPKDILWLSGQLGNLRGFYRVSNPQFNHWDFLWSTQVNEYLYDHLLANLP